MKPGHTASNAHDGNASRWDMFLAEANYHPFMLSRVSADELSCSCGFSRAESEIAFFFNVEK